MRWSAALAGLWLTVFTSQGGLAPHLDFSSDGTNLHLGWTGADNWLQASTSLTPDDWINLPLAAPSPGGNELVLPMTERARFFRLISSGLLPPPTRLRLDPEQDGFGAAWFVASWDAVPAATGYNLYLAADPTVNQNNYAVLAEGRSITGITNLFIPIDGLVPGHEYWAVVAAVSAGGQSADSNPASGIFGQHASVIGTVLTTVPDGTNQIQMPVPGALVTLSNAASPSLSRQTTTDGNGFFAFPAQPEGTYQLCCTATGFLPTCHSNALLLTTAALSIDLTLSNDNSFRLVFGHVSGATDTPAGQQDDFFGIQNTITVKANGVGPAVSRGAPVSDAGDYLIAGLPNQPGWQVTAANGIVSVSSNLSPAAVQRIDLSLPNQPPVITGLAARLNGSVVHRAPPGSPVEVTVTALDPDGDALHYRWIPGGDTSGLVSADAPGITWTLPQSEGLQMLYVRATDNRGGFATARLAISTAGGWAFNGQVVDPSGTAIGGAHVLVQGVPAISDSDGFFSVLVTNSSPVFTVHADSPGYVPFNQEFDAEESAVRCVLIPLPPCSAGSAIADFDLLDSRGSHLLIHSNTLRTLANSQPLDPVCVSLATLDPCDHASPFSPVAVGLDHGTNVNLRFLAMADVRARDNSGAALDLLAPAELNMAADPACLAGLTGAPPSMAGLWAYDEAAGVWRFAGEAQASTTAGGAPSFQAFSAQLGLLAVAEVPPEQRNFIVLDSDDTMSLPYVVRIRDKATGKLVREDTVRVKSLPVLVPPRALLVDVLSPKEAPEIFPPIPKNEDKTVIARVEIPATAKNLDHVTIGLYPQLANLPGRRANGSDRFLVFKFGRGNARLAEQYYDLIDPPQPVLQNGIVVLQGQRSTLAKWKEANDFTRNGVAQPDDATAFFFNASDLGFGRSMHFKRRRASDGKDDLAFYVSNHPGAADAIKGRDVIATVAMDYALNAQGKRIITFYAYNKAGARLLSADLDGRGEKFVPNLCLVCHGGDPAQYKGLEQGGKDPDLKARFIPFDPDSYTYADVRNQGQADQQAAFKKLNQAVLEGNATDAMKELVAGWYGGPNLPNGFNGAFAPAGWKNGPDPKIEAAYHGSVKIACRSCHITRTDDLAFGAFTDLNKNDVDRLVYRIPAKPMPNALRTFTIFWGSGGANILKPGAAPDQPELLQKALGLTGDRPTKFP